MAALRLALLFTLKGLVEFDNLRKHYEFNPPTTDLQKREQAVIILNIKKRHLLIERLLNEIKNLQGTINAVNKLNSEMDSILADLDLNYKDVDKRIYAD
jgi:formyltetrahydrofolate hydrolase